MRTVENVGGSSPIGATAVPRDVKFSIFSRHPSKIEFAVGLQSHRWHAFEHVCFIGWGFLFWRPVVQPCYKCFDENLGLEFPELRWAIAGSASHKLAIDQKARLICRENPS